MADDAEIVISTRDARKSELASLRTNMRGLEKDVAAAADQLERTGKGADELVRLNKRLDDTRATAARVAKEVRVLDGRVKDVEKSSTKVGRAWDSIGSKVRNNAREIRNAGAIAAAGVALLAKKSIDSASSLVESESKMAQVFGKMSATLDAWAQKAQAFGQSKRQAIDSASAFGIFGKAAGLEGQKLAEFSMELTELSSDMASFSNTSVQDASDSIGAALRGEAEPIRKYGVLLDDATLRQEALSLGLIKTTKTALLPQQRVLAAKSAILKQTTTAQGDFARTSDQLANSQRTLTAKWEDARAELGTQLLPVMLTLVTIAGKALSVFGALPGPVRTVAMVTGLVGIAAMIATPRLIALSDALGGRQGIADRARRARGGLGSTATFLRGPWGVALAGATVAVGLFAKAQSNAKNRADELKATLDAQNHAATESTYESIAKSLTTKASPSIWERINGKTGGGATAEEWAKVGISVGDATKAVIAGGDEYDAMLAKVRAAEAKTEGWGKPRNTAMSKALIDQRNAYQGSTAAAIAEAGAVASAGSAYDKTATKTDALTRAQGRLDAATKNVTTGFTTLDGVLDRHAAKDAAISATNALTQSLKENGRVFSGNSEKALANRAALRDVISADATYAKGITNKADRAKYVNSKIEELTRKLADAGLKPAQIAKLLKPFDTLRDKIVAAQRAAKDLADTPINIRTAFIESRQAAGRGVPIGDTATPKGRGIVGTSALMARHAELSKGLPGKRVITSMVRNHSLGSPNSDHRLGRAYDLVGPNLSAYKQRVDASGGFSEFHGSGPDRHLHVVPDAGQSGGAVNYWDVTVPGSSSEADAWAIGQAVVRGAQAEQRRIAAELT